MTYPNNFTFLTPKEAVDSEVVNTLKEAINIAKDERECENCKNHVWRYGQCGLCFSCTTGETDASGDYEIGKEY